MIFLLTNSIGKPLRESDLFSMLRKHLGFDYVCERFEDQALYSDEQVEAEDISPLSIPEALAMLPDKIIDNLNLASLQLNAHQVDKIIHVIAEQNSRLAHELTKLAKRFQYEQILSWIEQVRT
jgi:hypothetical protein